MLNYMITFLAFITLQLQNDGVEMANKFRGEGKIYIVIAIILVIMVGFFFYLFKLDKRSKDLEKKINEKLK